MVALDIQASLSFTGGLANDLQKSSFFVVVIHIPVVVIDVADNQLSYDWESVVEQRRTSGKWHVLTHWIWSLTLLSTFLQLPHLLVLAL